MWQICPKCNGQKRVYTPPWVPGDQRVYTTNVINSYTCPVCDGAGVIEMMTKPGKANVRKRPA